MKRYFGGAMLFTATIFTAGFLNLPTLSPIQKVYYGGYYAAFEWVVLLSWLFLGIPGAIWLFGKNQPKE
jgi:hypothetical protein